MTDRFSELLNGAQKAELVEIDTQDDEMDKVYSFSEDIKSKIQQCQNMMDDLLETHTALLAQHSDQSYARLNEEFNSLRGSINDSIQNIRADLDDFKDQNDAIEMEDNANGGASPNLVVRINLHKGLTTSFSKMLKRFMEVQNQYKEEKAKSLKTQYKINVDKNISDEDLEELLASDRLDDLLMEKQNMTSREVEVNTALNIVLERHREVQAISKSLSHLQELFQEFGVLLEIQKEQINEIDQNVTESYSYIVRANENLNKAITAKKKARKRMCCCMIILFIVIAILLKPMIDMLSSA
ncbi:hypothetical protein PCE1_000752 [Barthelona sp. PCE]